MVYDGLRDIYNDYHMGLTDENVAEKYGITREEQDEFAVSPHRKACAQKEGRFKSQIVPVEISAKKKGQPPVSSAVRYTLESPAEDLLLVREKLCILALLVAVGIFHAATVRQGHIWSDDFAMYVHHAQNIVEGRPHIDTGYIYNPSFPVYGPKFYPPIFPVLLAPIYRSFGLNLIPMKMEQVLFLLLALIAVYAYWRRDLSPGYTLALVALLGFNPEFWLAKDNVLSDIPFLFFFYLTALLVRSARRDSSGWWRWSAVIGVAIHLATGTRAVGIALLAGLLFYDVLRLRTITRFTVVAIVVCAAFLVLQPHIMGFGPDGYLYQSPTLHTIAGNIAAYARVLASFWVGSALHSFCTSCSACSLHSLSPGF